MRRDRPLARHNAVNRYGKLALQTHIGGDGKVIVIRIFRRPSRYERYKVSVVGVVFHFVVNARGVDHLVFPHPFKRPPAVAVLTSAKHSPRARIGVLAILPRGFHVPIHADLLFPLVCLHSGVQGFRKSRHADVCPMINHSFPKVVVLLGVCRIGILHPHILGFMGNGVHVERNLAFARPLLHGYCAFKVGRVYIIPFSRWCTGQFIVCAYGGVSNPLVELHVEFVFVVGRTAFCPFERTIYIGCAYHIYLTALPASVGSIAFPTVMPPFSAYSVGVLFIPFHLVGHNHHSYVECAVVRSATRVIQAYAVVHAVSRSRVCFREPAAIGLFYEPICAPALLFHGTFIQFRKCHQVFPVKGYYRGRIVKIAVITRSVEIV